jgi:hypothetical protein
MHRSEDVAAMAEDLVFAMRGMLLALPGKLGIEVADAAGLADPARVVELIRSEVYIVMGELSRYRYDSEKYAERVRQRRSWDKTRTEGDADEQG